MAFIDTTFFGERFWIWQDTASCTKYFEDLDLGQYSRVTLCGKLILRAGQTPPWRHKAALRDVTRKTGTLPYDLYRWTLTGVVAPGTRSLGEYLPASSIENAVKTAEAIVLLIRYAEGAEAAS